jgi:hypothetical protein
MSWSAFVSRFWTPRNRQHKRGRAAELLLNPARETGEDQGL